MSPNYFKSGDAAANEWDMQDGGYFGTGRVPGGYGVRAVINLKSDVEITSGIGTSNDPFVVKETA